MLFRLESKSKIPPAPCNTNGKILHDKKIYENGAGLIRAKEVPNVSILDRLSLLRRTTENCKYLQVREAEINASGIKERAYVQENHLDKRPRETSAL
jgi:hypothetical protein